MHLYIVPRTEVPMFGGRASVGLTPPTSDKREGERTRMRSQKKKESKSRRAKENRGRMENKNPTATSQPREGPPFRHPRPP